MEGVVLEIPDHPKTGHKIKVEITGFEFSWNLENIVVKTTCRYYENIDGEFGPLVTEPTKIVFDRPVVADTLKDQFVDSRTGQELKRKFRDVPIQIGEEPIPEEEQEEGGPTTQPIYEMQEQEYWVLFSDEETEVPVEYVQRMFFFFENIVRNASINVPSLLIQYITEEVQRGTYYQVGR